MLPVKYIIKQAASTTIAYHRSTMQINSTVSTLVRIASRLESDSAQRV